MKLLIIISSIILSQHVLGQTSTYQGPCCDENGKTFNPSHYTNNVYQVKRHRRKTPINITIKSFEIGDSIFNIDISYKDKIKHETPVITLNERYAIKYILGKAVENGINKYLYKLIIYKRDKEKECWRPLSIFNSFYEVINQTLSLDLYSIGIENTDEFFQIKDGWVKLN